MNIQRPALSRPAAWLLAALLMCLGAGGAHAAAALSPVDGEVIVGFKPHGDTLRVHGLAARATRADVDAVLGRRAAALGGRVKRALQSGPAVGAQAQVMRVAGMDAHELARQLAADPDVAYAVPNGRKRATTAPNDPLYAEAAPGVRARGPDAGQWYLRAPTATLASAINIEAAWLRTIGSASVVVAVLDTGVRPEHPDLVGRLLEGADFVSDVVLAGDGDGFDRDASDPGDYVSSADLQADRARSAAQRRFIGRGCDFSSSSSWHGTSTASLVGAAANNGVGMAGAAPGVRVLPVRVLGKCYGTDADIQAGMLWAAGISQPGIPDNPNPARVINMSLGGSGSCDAAYQNIVNQVVARGVVIVASAGNSVGGAVSTPANCSGVIGVAALRHVGTKVGFSDLGAEISISAPGGNCVNSTGACLYPVLAASDAGSQGPAGASWSDSFNFTVGTSFSSPLVAAVAALMVSQRPSLTPAEVRTAMRASARPFPQTGADNGAGDPTPVTQCHAPVAGVDQSQCYCNTAVCGGGMLDAGAAVAAVSGPQARVEVSTASPTAGLAVALSGASSLGTAGAAVTRYDWVLVSGGGIVTAFASATNAVTASLTPSAAGSFTVRLTVTDASGATDAASTTVTVAATPVVTPPTSGGGGGGAASLWWVLGVLLAVALLHTWRPHAAVQRQTGPQ